MLMKLNKLPFFILISLMAISCSGGGGGGSSAPAVTLTSIAVSPANLTIASGTTGQFTATGTYSDGSIRNISTSVTWRSSNTAVATISTSGLAAAAVAAGSTTITASSGSISDTATLTAAMITSLTITPANQNTYAGRNEQFTATGTLPGNKTQILTSGVSWSSDAEAVSIINSTGLATAATTGSAKITATWSGVSDSTSLTVIPDNVIPITVNGSLCSEGSYPNKPCVSITVCSPGTSNCKTINDILLDTGSVGLRIFKSLLTDIPLTQITSGTRSLANCAQYIDGSVHWGPVQIADIILGNEKASNVPIHIIDSSFGRVPSSCGTPDATPGDSGFNGILGAGLFTEDCGAVCASLSGNGIYYSCGGSTCSGTTAPLSDQIKNPVSMLTNDNNGFIVRLDDVPPGGAVSADGVLILGIGTQLNNNASGVTAFSTNSYGEFTTTFDGTDYSDSFMDSGSNGLFFNKGSVSALTECGGWYCPSSTQILSANIEGGAVSFNIGNASTLLSLSNPNNVFSELGGTYESFDWGLPFFLGRSVFVGIDGKTSSLGTGPYLAY
jgi:hypothetical protein